MKPRLLEVLCCPACRSPLRLVAEGDGAGEVERGELACAGCGRGYPVRDGVPRLLLDDGLVAATRRGFEYQWWKRVRGRAERRSTLYGYDIGRFMRWLVGELGPGRGAIPPGAWMLDAGCGSGEKARELALLHPGDQVVALDQSDSIAETARQERGVPNLHFVQGNVLAPPLRAGTFHFAMSIGVLHHTPDTRRAFGSVAPLVAPGGGLLTWIYPLPEEDSFWAGLYRQRDRHFLGLGHRLPNRLTMALCRLYVAALFPLVLRFLKAQVRINRKRFPIYPEKPSLWDVYQSSVFLSFDNVMPRHQFRHGRPEVEGWYRELGFESVDDRYPGFFHGVRPRESLAQLARSAP
jgi:uncharacterized protein YbaR (Trm112 family)/ubiquinone/menaquinone biosynthesis C-methylase UbiE